MDNDYSWTKFNPAAARKLCAYSDRREELLTWLYSALPEETNYLHGPEPQKADGYRSFHGLRRDEPSHLSGKES